MGTCALMMATQHKEAKMQRLDELALAGGGVLARMERVANNGQCLVLSGAGLTLLQQECSKAGLPITIKHNPRGGWWVSKA